MDLNHQLSKLTKFVIRMSSTERDSFVDILNDK